MKRLLSLILFLCAVVLAQPPTIPPYIQVGTITPPATSCTSTAIGNVYLYVQATALTLYHCAQASVGTGTYLWTSDAPIARTDVANTFTGVQTMTAPTINGLLSGASATFSSTVAATGAITPTGGVIQSTVTTPYTAFTTLAIPNNIVAPAAITDTVAEYWSQIFIPTNVTLTGACLLNGATVTTDKHIVILFNAAGAVIANSALAGAADTGNASAYQCQAFTAPIAVTGPATYFVGTQPNGTTDTFFTYTAKGAPTNYGTGLTTCAVFGTLCSITPTSTFTTAQGPLMMVY